MANVSGSLGFLAIGVILASCAVRPVALEPGKVSEIAQISLAPGSWGQLSGWSGDNVAQALPAFVKSCDRIAQGKPDSAPLDPSATAANFGKAGDWRPLCHQAAALQAGDEAAARQFFETRFTPVLIASRGTSRGLFTGYWEVELDGARSQGGPYQVPVYRKPADLVAGKPYLDRAAIEDGALAGKVPEVMWLKSADDLFVLQMQGSGRIRQPDGSTVRLVYEANNNRPLVNVYQMLLDGGDIPKAQFSETAVRAWMRDNPDRAKELRRKDPLYVFFQELKGDGPVGYQGAVLTAERSLAVDHKYIPLGVPLWLDAHDKYRAVAVQRLVVAQDIGDGITGPLRGDFYWGSGKKAQARGSDFYADGQYWVLLPKTIASRMVASLN
ncbi:MAG TPA: MltA domain-containing protein [Stellaceae bacterium]|nr:MltA domain-containing protein [Stellaceae bacterium]